MLLPLGWVVCVSLLAPAAVPAPYPSRAPTEAELALKVDRYFGAVGAMLPPGPRSVLPLIPERGRRMLATAHYLRRRHQLDELWVWTPAEAAAYQATEHYRRAMRELRRVRDLFAARHPGYVLITDTTARGLISQVHFWNRERSVWLAGRELDDSVREWLSERAYPGQPDTLALGRLVTLLLDFSPCTTATVAVPGLSRHGRLQAFDFVVLRRGRIVAGPTTATMDSVWYRSGWADRLRSVVSEAGQAFDGPLRDPPEPWHYEYRPETR